MPQPSIELDVAIIDATDVEAQIEVRTRCPGRSFVQGDFHFRGTLTGPFCEGTRTLPARIPLRITGIGDECIAQAVVVDPCFWSPEMPYVYRVEMEVESDGQTERHEQMIGLGRTTQTHQ
jgi:hypothetical protein